MQIVITQETWQWMFWTIKYFVTAKGKQNETKQTKQTKPTPPPQKKKTEKIQNQKRGKITENEIIVFFYSQECLKTFFELSIFRVQVLFMWRRLNVYDAKYQLNYVNRYTYTHTSITNSYCIVNASFKVNQCFTQYL